MTNRLKKMLAIVLIITMAMSISMPAFANTETNQEITASMTDEFVVDLKTVQPGTVLHKDTVYLLADGSMVNSYAEAQEAETRGIPIINFIYRVYGLECWYDDEVVVFCEYTADDPIIKYVHTYFYAQDEADLIPEDATEAIWWTHDYSEEDGVYYTAVSRAYITARLAIPECYTLRVGLFNTYAETTDGSKSFEDSSTVVDR